MMTRPPASPIAPVQRRPHQMLRRRIARHLGVGRIGTQQQHAAGAPPRQRGQVDGMPVHRRVVNLEIAGMDDRPVRRVNADAHRIRYAVAHPKPGRPKIGAEVHRLLRLHGIRRHIPRAPPFVQFDADEPMRQPGGVHRRRQIRQHIGQRPDVVLVPVRNQNPPHPLRPRRQVGHIGDNQIHPRHILRRKLDAAVHHHNILPALQRHHILADLPQPPQRNHPQRRPPRPPPVARNTGIARNTRIVRNARAARITRITRNARATRISRMVQVVRIARCVGKSQIGSPTRSGAAQRGHPTSSENTIMPQIGPECRRAGPAVAFPIGRFSPAIIPAPVLSYRPQYRHPAAATPSFRRLHPVIPAQAGI